MAGLTDVLVSLLGGNLAAPPSQEPIFTIPGVNAPGGFQIPGVTSGSEFQLPGLSGGGGFQLPGFGNTTADFIYPVVQRVLQQETPTTQNTKTQNQPGRGVTRTRPGEQAQAVGAAAQNRINAAVPPTVPAEYQAMLGEAAQRYGVDPALLAAQLKQESMNFDPEVVAGRRLSPMGAAGIAQFMPGTARQYGVDVNDPRSSIEGMAHYMSDLLAQYNGNQQEALAAYNGGSGAVQRLRAGQPYGETQQYLSAVQSNLQQYRDAAGVLSAQAVQQAGARGPLQAVNQYDYATAAGLPKAVADAICGPAAADAFVRSMGRNPTAVEAFDLAKQRGYWAGEFQGPAAMVNLINDMGGSARQAPLDANTLGAEIQAGRPVLIDTRGHWYQATAYDPQTRQFQFGDAVGRGRWSTLEGINNWGYGPARTAIAVAGP